MTSWLKKWFKGKKRGDGSDPVTLILGLPGMCGGLMEVTIPVAECERLERYELLDESERPCGDYRKFSLVLHYKDTLFVPRVRLGTRVVSTGGLLLVGTGVGNGKCEGCAFDEVVVSDQAVS